ncbi:MAG TPA: hypothetical protein VFE47_11975 [Tepidisphaeraceae bacterium]|jgi:hypothetical protein|nr:hypothetical protein [Tepidisphaeraceae bacterium]
MKMNRNPAPRAILGTLLLLISTCASAQQPTSVGDENKGKWSNFTEAFNKASGKSDFRLTLAVDRASGKLFVSQWFTGVWMSSDKAESFSRADGGKISAGGPFSCYAMLADPEGGRLAVFNMNNKPGPSGYSLDGGKTWESFAPVGRNWDYGAIDWESKAVLAFRHEDNGVHFSPDLGKTWSQLDLKRGELFGLGIFGARELVISNWQSIQRSADGGKTWATVAPYPCTGTVQIYKGTGYWLSNKWMREEKRWSASLLMSNDKGKTWQESGKPLQGTMFCSGPFFGKDERQLFVATLKGIVESIDGGATWRTVADYPADAPPFGDHKNGCGFPSLGFDPAGNVFYVFLPNVKKWPDGQLYKYVR